MGDQWEAGIHVMEALEKHQGAMGRMGQGEWGSWESWLSLLGDTIFTPGSYQVFPQHRSDGLGSAGVMLGLSNLKGLFQPG